MLVVGIDVPPRSLSRTQSGWSGLDYYAGLHGGQQTALLVKASPTGASPGRVLAQPKVRVSGRTLSFSLGRSRLGNPAWIEFAVAAGRESSDGGASGGSDEAPDHGIFHYRLR